MTRLLLIEDDPDIALIVRHAFEKDPEFTVEREADGPSGLRRALADPPDLVLLDLNLPGLDGMEVCRALRREPATRIVPIIMLTARIAESDTVEGLEVGADDYITKPFSIREVVARVRALLRRSSDPTEPRRVLSASELEVDVDARTVVASGEEVRLTRKEFDLLEALLRHRGRVLTRERLLETVWGYDHAGTTRTVDVHIRHLRRKLGEGASAGIETVVGVGYRFVGDGR